MKKPELLAPAGSFEHFKAAVENGADAVYFGGKMFNARQYADNFTDEEIKKAVKYAHSKGVKVYMTMNTLVGQTELEQAVRQAGEGAAEGIDAFIVQDMGLAGLLKEEFPHIPLHLSTQGTVYDSDGVKYAESLGFKRVVLAREMSLEDIKKCAEETEAELEIFVHGALCMCLSGQCAMSCLIGERSGNRGSCAQPCRKRYSLETVEGERIGEPGFLLSPRDISYLDELDGIIKSGVSSLKIEGRLKSPEYTALTVKTFRRYLDEAFESGEKPMVLKEDIEKLEQVFNRGGLSKGYLYGKQNAGILSGESPKHRGLFLGTVRNTRPSSVNSGKSVLEIDLKRELAVGDGIEIIGKGMPGGIVTYIRSSGGNVKSAGAGEKVWAGDIQGRIKKGDMIYKVSDRSLMKDIRQTYEKADTGREPVKGFFFAHKGGTIAFEAEDTRGRRARAEGSIILEKAVKAPTDREAVLKQLSGMGNTPYILAECSFDMDEDLMIPMSEVKKVRRKALESLENGKE
ncbi:MAG: U32 family peptidase [Bacillota bacterium]|nr:U32 family peptidase [Bacillota bacterium]